MANPLMSLLANSTGNLERIRQMYQYFQMAQNPQYALYNLMQQNPKLAETVQLCRGRDPQQVFYELCKQQNVDPNSILNNFR